MNKWQRGPMAALAALLLFAATAHPQEFRGRVVAVADGDTLTVMKNGAPAKIRLEGIDCPEKKQPFGDRAYMFAFREANNQTVAIRPKGKDRYGRIIGDVILPDGRSLNAELVRLGLAWHYKKYSSDKNLARLEREARAAGSGLWSQADPTAPWDWRRGKR